MIYHLILDAYTHATAAAKKEAAHTMESILSGVVQWSPDISPYGSGYGEILGIEILFYNPFAGTQVILQSAKTSSDFRFLSYSVSASR